LKYRAEIDGLRALAVVPVILFHAGFELFSGGFVGVDVFFVISGYLITTILIEDIENKRFSIVNFYERRARRILPVLFFVMLVCIPFAWMWMLPSQMKDFSQSLVAVSFFASNILFWKKSGYFDAAAEEKPLLHTWSLAVEEQYYVLFPIFIILAWRFGKNRVFWMIVVMAAVSLLLSEWGWRKQPTANFYLAPTRAWELCSGSIAAFVVQRQGVQKNNLLALAGLVAIVFSIFFYDESTPFPSVYALVPVLGVVLLVLYADKETFAAKLLSTKGFVGIGLISYSAYLWHQPLFAFARIKLISEPTDLIMISLAFSSLLMAYLSWKFVESPFRKVDVISRIKIFVYALLGLTIFFLFGLFGHFNNGYASLRAYLPFVVNEENFRKVGEERQEAIRAGICHFNRRGRYIKIDEFVENWNCIDSDEGLKPTGIVITGDSHSADKAVSLRLNGFDTYQVGGAGCQLSETYVARDRSYCKAILRKARDLARENHVQAVFLSNRFKESELSEEYLQSIFNYWSDIDKPIFLWAPMPNFQQQLDGFLRGINSSIRPDNERETKFYELLKKVNVPQNFVIIKTSDMWCSSTESEGCVSFTDNQVLMADEDHLGVKGAEIFGQLVINNSTLKSFFDK
jgi:peptidoglycan/LPS O-acetylase OafA/YrhL